MNQRVATSQQFDPATVLPERVISRSKKAQGVAPAPDSLRPYVCLIRMGDGRILECVADSFTANNDYFAWRNHLAKQDIKPTNRVVIPALDIKSIYDRAEAKFANAPSGVFRADQAAEATAKDSREFFYSIIRDAAAKDVSDVHFVVRQNGSGVFYRLFADIIKKSNHTYEQLNGVISVIYNKDADPGSTSHSNFSPTARSYCAITSTDLSVKLRWQTVPLGYDGEFDVIVRIIPMNKEAKIKSLKSLGYLPDQERELTAAALTPKGGIFMAGVTGSGKSTTLRTLMSMAYSGGARKLYSVEDPIEGKMYGVSQIAIQRNDEGGAKVSPFAESLKMLMRADPDVVMCGEIRDHETAGAAEEVIRTGHQMLTTVHAGSAMGIIGRLASSHMGIPRDVLAEPDFISMLIYQTLIPVLCESCKIPAITANVLDEGQIYDLTSVDRFGLDFNGLYVRNHDGCPACRSRLAGISGMTVCAEIVTPTWEILQYIHEGRIADAILAWRGQRIAGFDQEGTTGKVAHEVALYKASQGLVDPRDIEKSFEPFSRMQIIKR